MNVAAARAARHCLAAALCGLLAACGGDEPAAPPAERAVKGAVVKGAVVGATVKFFTIDAAGDPLDPLNPVATVTTDANGQFTATLPSQGVHLLAQTFDGSYADESDPAPRAQRRRIALPTSPTIGFEAVLPPNATTFAITPYSNALLKKARIQANGINFFNVFDAVRAQATQAFGFDPITTIPVDPVSPAGAASVAQRQYALLLGAASQAINTIATTAGHLPDFADVMLFVDDLGTNGIFELVSIDEEIRRFRSNNFQIYSGVPLPVIDQVLLSQPATVPNARPVAVADSILVSEGGTETLLSGGNASVLDNDTDAEGSTLTAAVASGPGAGNSLSLATDGTFTYTHGGSESATDSFTYVANDGTINSLPATVSITVSAVNDAPVATDDPNYTGAVGGTVTAIAGAGGVRDNDTDVDNARADLSVTTTPVTPPSFAAAFTLGADGGFSYTHDGSANLVDTFTYEVCDLAGPQQLCDTAVATITVSATPSTESVLPLLTSAGDLQLVDPSVPIDGVNNPLTIESGLPVPGFSARTLQRADITGGIATDIREARLVYIKDNGSTRTLWKVDLEAGGSRTPVQVSNITDACRINGMAEDIPNPDNAILRIDTAGTNGICEDGGGDDFATAEAYLVPLTTGAAQPGVLIGFGHCCGITAISDANGALLGVLGTEDDGSGSTLTLTRRDVGSLASPTPLVNLDIAGTGQIYGHFSRGLGDQHIYVRAKRTSVDTNYMLLRVNVAAGNSLTPLYDYGTADAATFVGDFDNTTLDASNLYFTSADGAAILRVAHAATGTGQTTTLATVSPSTPVVNIVPAPAHLVYETSGPSGGVFSVPKTTGSPVTLALNDAIPTVVRLAGANGSRVFIDKVAGTASPVLTAFAVDADGANPSADITDAQWAGGTFHRTCDFNETCEDTIGFETLYLRRLASTTDAQFEVADPLTGVPSGSYLGTIFNVADGFGAFVAGFGRYAQVLVLADLNGQTDLFLGDSQLASPTPPPEALVAVANAGGAGDNQWLLFGTDDGGGGGGSQDPDLDGLTNAQETALGTNPNDFDTDDDGLGDGEEVNTHGTSPLLPDSDGDGLSDSQEVSGTGTNPLLSDTDGDDVGDGVEIETGTDAIATVNNVIYVDPAAGCTAACDGTSWATAWPDETSVSGANNVSGTDSLNVTYVLFASGLYGPLDLTGLDRKHIAYVGSVGPGIPTPVFPPSTQFTGFGTQRAMTITQSEQVIFSYVAFVNGFHTTLGGGVSFGPPANTEFLQNTVHFRHVQVTTGVSGDSGGGVAVEGNTTFLFIDKSEITGNQSQGNTGAQVGGGGLLAFNGGDITVTETLIAGNTAICAQPSCVVYGGGAAVSGGTSTIALTDSIVEGNNASTNSGSAAGGGLSADTSGVLNVFSTEVRQNTANVVGPGQAGGGGIAASAADLQLQDSVVKGNTSSGGVVAPPLGGGGGVYLDGLGTLDMARTIVADNKAQAGPGGGINLVDSGTVVVEDSKFLSNSSLNPGGGLHIHPQGLTSVFNNLFVGNVATDAAAEGGAMELDVESGNPILSFDSNTIAYNQTTGSSGLGGGISVKATVPATLPANNNNIWFNQDVTATANTGDNFRVSGAMTVNMTGDNIDEGGLTGNIRLNPAFVQGFYLNPVLPSPSIDAGNNTFAGPVGGAPYTTNPDGTADSPTPAVDIGFHHQQASAGSLDSVATTPFRTFSCASSDNFIFTPSFANAPNGEPGHLIVVELTGVTPTLGSLMTMAPRGGASRVARDLGDGRYAVTTSGFQSGSATGTFTIYADEQTTPQTFTITFTNAC